MMWEFMLGFRKKEVRVRYDFEYRVVAKKGSKGNIFYIGESTTEQGRIIGLYHELYGPRGAPVVVDCHIGPHVGWPPVPVPRYVLVSHDTARMMAYRRVEFTDPIAVKEVICRMLQEAKDKAKNRAYSEVVSEGACKC